MRKGKCTVLMSTYNGDLYLTEQIESILNQKNVEINIVVRDDGSTDQTINILEKYANQGLLEWYSGHNIGPAKSFLDLLVKTKSDNFIAFADQDDVWIEDKIYRALEMMNYETDIPLLYIGNEYKVDSNLKIIKTSFRNNIIDFMDLIYKNTAVGCTMVLNSSLMKIINEYQPKSLIMHDWWIHIVCKSTNIKIIYDDYQSVLHRIHSNNATVKIDSNLRSRVKSRLKRLQSRKSILSSQIIELFFGYSKRIDSNKLKYMMYFIDYKRLHKVKVKLLLFTLKRKISFRARLLNLYLILHNNI